MIIYLTQIVLRKLNIHVQNNIFIQTMILHFSMIKVLLKVNFHNIFYKI